MSKVQIDTKELNAQLAVAEAAALIEARRCLLLNQADDARSAAEWIRAGWSTAISPEEYLEHIAKAKKTVSIPIIASLNGSTPGGWTDYAKKMQQAGADALELNIYSIPTDMDLAAADVEQAYVDILKAVKTAVINKRAGGMGLISGRKAFQKPLKEGVEILNAIQDVYLAKEVTIA